MLYVRDLDGNGRLRLRGADRVRFLQGMLTNDVARLAPGQACHASMLTVKGKLVGDMIVQATADTVDLDLAPEVAGAVRQAMERYLIADDVTIDDHTRSLGEIGLYGDGAAAAAAALGPDKVAPESYHFVEGGGWRVLGVPDLVVPSYRVYGGPAEIATLVAKLVDGGATRLDEAGWEVLRVEAGRPRYGVDSGLDHLPVESRLEHTISYDKGCFLGQEVIVRLRDQGHLNWRLMGLRLDGEGVAPTGSVLAAIGRPDAGKVTSSVVSPRLGAIALAYVHRSQLQPGSHLEVQEPDGRRRSAVVVELPFDGS